MYKMISQSLKPLQFFLILFSSHWKKVDLGLTTEEVGLAWQAVEILSPTGPQDSLRTPKSEGQICHSTDFESDRLPG